MDDLGVGELAETGAVDKLHQERILVLRPRLPESSAYTTHHPSDAPSALLYGSDSRQGAAGRTVWSSRSNICTISVFPPMACSWAKSVLVPT
jgi:hypothetical protein